MLPLALALSLSTAQAEVPVSRIALGSCFNSRLEMRLWPAIQASKPEVFIWMGDNTYVDGQGNSLDHATEYKLLGQDPGFQWLEKNTKQLATWDDHDYGLNDAGVEYPKKVLAQAAFNEFWKVPADSPRRKREGIYDSTTFGPEGKRIQVILLDTRYFRSPLKRDTDNRRYVGDPDPEKTLLGANQWTWLAEELKKPAELRIIVSSIQVVSEDHPFEKWMNHPLERAKLFTTIKESQASGVMFVSGDRHMADLSAMDGGVGYPLYDLTSSALNRSNRGWRFPEKNQHRLGAMVTGDNFGFIAVDWSKPDPEIKLQVRDQEGENTIQTKLNLSWLKPGRIRTP